MTKKRVILPLVFLIAVQLLVIGLLGVPYAGQLPDVTAHIYWYMGRSAGFVAYWLLFASVAMGLAVSSRVFDGMFARPWVFEVHKFLSIFVIIVMVFHALILLPDPYAGFTLAELLIPFKSHYRATAVGVGAIVLYGSIIMTASFYLKGFIGGQKGWRMLHYLTFALFIGAMAHGIWSGTDSGKSSVQISYLASGVAVLFLTFFRILASRAVGAKPKSRPAKAAGGEVARKPVTAPPAPAAGAPAPAPVQAAPQPQAMVAAQAANGSEPAEPAAAPTLAGVHLQPQPAAAPQTQGE